jgi:hypothetical protein
MMCMRYFQVAPIDQRTLVGIQAKLSTMASRLLHGSVRLLMVAPMTRDDSGRRMVLAFDEGDPVQAEEITLLATVLTEVHPYDHADVPGV